MAAGMSRRERREATRKSAPTGTRWTDAWRKPRRGYVPRLGVLGYPGPRRTADGARRLTRAEAKRARRAAARVTAREREAGGRWSARTAMELRETWREVARQLAESYGVAVQRVRITRPPGGLRITVDGREVRHG